MTNRAKTGPCHVCGVALTSENRKSGGMPQRWCISCFEARGHKCSACGTTDVTQFGGGKRTRCKPCRNLIERAEGKRRWDGITYAPQCDICGMRDSHVSEGLCVLCKREETRPKANRTPWRVEEAA